MEILSEKLRPSYSAYQAEVDRLAHECQTSGPYTHCVLDPLCDTSFLAEVHRELTTNMKANFKETDLFKVFQTAELGAISEESLQDNMPSFLKLRNVIYSQEFRNMIQRITGCTELIDRVDCSANAYANSCHLLCHDDVIGTRCVSYIIYLSDPDDPWTVEEGGAVELYPLDPSSIVDPTNLSNLQGVPVANPTKSILPTFNSMLFFTVQPGRSYHSVQEVFSKHRPRLSISGWYHAAQPPVGSDMSSLQQILSKGDKVDEYTNIPYQVVPTEEMKTFPSGSIFGLTRDDVKELSKWLSSDYLNVKAISRIRKQFIEDSSVQLHNFLSPTISEDILSAIITADHTDKLGKGRPSLDYSVGVTSEWSVLGPPHKKRYLQYTPTGEATETGNSADNAGKYMSLVGEFLKSELFAKYVSAITTMILLSYQQEVRRFRPGFDYTVAHYSLLTKEKHLDATLCFVNDDKEVEDRVLEALNSSGKGKATKNKKRKAEVEKKKKGKKSSATDGKDEEEEEIILEAGGDEEDYGILWEDGDVGGFECFIEADDDAENAEAAEVYRQEKDGEEEDEEAEEKEEEDEKDLTTSDKTKNRKEQTTLLSVSALSNSLSLVLRDEGIMKFVKYVSANAPGSRWDIATEYKVLDTGDDDEDDDGSDSNEDSEAEDVEDDEDN
eukprot:gene4293-3066_t